MFRTVLDKIGKEISGYYPGIDSLVALGLRSTKKDTTIRLFGSVAIRITNNKFEEHKDLTVKNYKDKKGNTMQLDGKLAIIDLHYFGFDRSWQESLLDNHFHYFDRVDKYLSKYFFYKDYKSFLDYLKNSTELLPSTPIIVHTNVGFGLLLSGLGFHKSVLDSDSIYAPSEMFATKRELLNHESKLNSLITNYEEDINLKNVEFMKRCLLARLNQFVVQHKNKKFTKVRKILT